MRRARAYPAEPAEAACRRALDIGTLRYKSVKSILSTGLNQVGHDERHSLSLPAEHATSGAYSDDADHQFRQADHRFRSMPITLEERRSIAALGGRVFGVEV